MISIHENKRSTRTNELRQLLSQINIRTIEDDLFTKSITQKRKEIRVKTKKRRKLSTNNKVHIIETDASDHITEITLLQEREPIIFRLKTMN